MVFSTSTCACSPNAVAASCSHFQTQAVRTMDEAAQWFSQRQPAHVLPTPCTTFFWDSNHLLFIDLLTLILHRTNISPILATFLEHCLFDYRLHQERPDCGELFRHYVSSEVEAEYSLFSAL